MFFLISTDSHIFCLFTITSITHIHKLSPVLSAVCLYELISVYYDLLFIKPIRPESMSRHCTGYHCRMIIHRKLQSPLSCSLETLYVLPSLVLTMSQAKWVMTYSTLNTSRYAQLLFDIYTIYLCKIVLVSNLLASLTLFENCCFICTTQ